MFGLQAITQNNGWMMALTGAAIVFLGLALLAIIISQFPKLFLVLDWIEKKRRAAKENKTKKIVSQEENVAEVSSLDTHELVRLYKPLIDQLPLEFPLASLYALSAEYDYPHPYMSVSRLRDATVLIPAKEEGLFQWNHAVSL